MRRTEQIRLIESLIEHLDEGTNVDVGYQVKNPVETYTSPERSETEWRAFFQSYPQVVGLSGDLPEPNSFFTVEDFGKPVLCTRDKDGKFHAFINSCRHRGTFVESESRGKRSVFSCPFHAWSYSPSGELVAVPKENHFGSVDKSCLSLVSLPAEERNGILWVHPDPEGTLDADELLGQDLSQELAEWNLADMSLEGEDLYQHEMNWKLAIDTFGETYHFNFLHKDTLAQDFYGNVQMYDTFKRNHRMMLCMKSIEELRNVSTEDWHVLACTLPVYYLFPNIQLILSQAGPILVRIYPNGPGPDDSFSKITFYLRPEIAALREDPEFDNDAVDISGRLRGFRQVIRDEDYVAAASSHRGLAAGGMTHIIFGRNEPALHHYHNTYREALGMEPLERLEDQNE